MGRHSRRAPRVRNMGRAAMNSLFVLTATSFSAVLIYAGITVYATAKMSAQVPPIDRNAWARTHTSPSAVQGSGAGEHAAPAYANGSNGTMRRCPATGCTASTCHAETGEPTPRW
jgi:hypothetical protein